MNAAPDIETKSGRPLQIGMGMGTQWKSLKFAQKTKCGEIVEEIVDQICLALKNGYYHIDTAEVYTTHPEVGAAIRKSGQKREDVFITSKFNGGIKGAPRISKDPTEAIQKILKDLHSDYLDLYLIHQPFFDDDPSLQLKIKDAWTHMVELKLKGKVRYIGVSNFSVTHIEKIMQNFSKPFHPQVNQIEFHPYLQEQSPGIVDFCHKNSIVMEAYAPLAPLLRFREKNPLIEEHPLNELLIFMMEKYAKTDAQILLKYCLQKSFIPITTSSKVQRIKESLEVYDFEMSSHDVNLIDHVGSKAVYRSFFTKEYG